MADYVTVTDVMQWKAVGERVVLIDVRLAQIGSIPDSVHVPVTDLEDKEWDWDPESRLVVFCQYGRGASDYAAEVLEEQGHSRVFKLQGGMDAWVALGQG